MESVKVVLIESDFLVMFLCVCWLVEDVWDSKIERELFFGKVVKRFESKFWWMD